MPLVVTQVLPANPVFQLGCETWRFLPEAVTFSGTDAETTPLMP